MKIKSDKWLLKELMSWYHSNEWVVEPTVEECLAVFAANCEDYFQGLAEEYNQNLCEEASACFGHVDPNYYAPTTGVVFGLEFTFREFLHFVDIQQTMYYLEEEPCGIPESVKADWEGISKRVNFDVLSTDELNELYNWRDIYYKYQSKVALKEAQENKDEFELPF